MSADLFTPQQIASFWSRVQRSDSADGCWNWAGLYFPTGYGRHYYMGNSRRAHRFAYMLLVGEIPEGLCLDHLCRNRGCVNPAHLEPVTNEENLKRSALTLPGSNVRKTHCPRGHAYDHVRSDGARVCTVCRRSLDRRRTALRRRAEAVANDDS